MKLLSVATAGLLVCTCGAANADLQTGEGIGLITTLSESGINSQTDSMLYGSTANVFNGSAAGLTNELSATTLYAVPVVTTTPGAMPAGLTSGALSLTYPDGASQAFVSASLGTGTIHSYASGLAYNGVAQSDVFTTGVLSDSLHWSVTGGGSADVTVSVHLDGTVQNSQLSSFTTQVLLQIGSPFMEFIGANGNGGGTIANPFWVSESFSNVTMTGFDFIGVVNIADGGTTAISMTHEIDPCGYGLTCDYNDTAQISIALPAGVSYTSDSGEFLTQTSTPEPGTLGLLAAGASGVAFARRRRRLPLPV